MVGRELQQLERITVVADSCYLLFAESKITPESMIFYLKCQKLQVPHSTPAWPAAVRRPRC